MELLNKFPKGFFSMPSAIAEPTKNPNDEIIPIKWKKNTDNKKIKVESTKKRK